MKYAQAKNPPVYLSSSSEWKLTTSERKRILLNNIYGVDIDPQAVEVTKLSLLLKVLEGETEETLTSQFKFFRERALPDLGSNIKCGNSLIGPDFYQQTELGLITDEERMRINVFDWQKEFPDVFKNSSGHSDRSEESGFDVVIGNPPWVRSKLLEIQDRKYYDLKYKTAKGTYDIYILFIEISFRLLNRTGILGCISPNKFFFADYGKVLRKIIKEYHSLLRIINFHEFQVFKKITTYSTVCIFLKNNSVDSFEYGVVKNKKIKEKDIVEFLSTNKKKSDIDLLKINLRELNDDSWIFRDSTQTKLLARLNKENIPLSKLCYKIYQGFVLTPTEVFPISILRKTKDYYLIKPIKADDNIYELEKEFIIPIIKSSNIFKYCFEQENYYAIFPYRYINERQIELVNENELQKKFPKTFYYLIQKQHYLKTREKGKWAKSKKWYEYSRKQNFECQRMSKILVPGLATKARYCLASSGHFIDQGSYGIILDSEFKYLEKYLLGVLNSRLLDYCLKSISGTLSGGYYSYQNKYLSLLPIKLLPEKNELLNKIERFVDLQIELTNKTASVQFEFEKNTIQRQIDATDREIDRLVYELYGLTEEEIEIVESAK